MLSLFKAIFMVIIVHLKRLFLKLLFCFLIKKEVHFYQKKTEAELTKEVNNLFKNARKPEWAIRKIIYLKAHLPHAGCRKIADEFNRLYSSTGVSISKSTVYNIFIKYSYDIYAQRREIRNRKPKATPKNVTWSLDLTTITCDGTQNTIMGVIDNGTRANLLLKHIANKTSITLLKQLISIIELYGKPKKLRMDNEANFKSKTFRLGLFILGIKPQYIEVACPWMNGRIERFFGTLKSHIRKIVLTQDTLEKRLFEFRYFYNHIRTHSNLKGRTPAEVWDKKTHNKRGEVYYFELWQGVLSGFYLPPE